MTEELLRQLAEYAYNFYGRSRGWGYEKPAWYELKPEIREDWKLMVEEVTKKYLHLLVIHFEEQENEIKSISGESQRNRYIYSQFNDLSGFGIEWGEWGSSRASQEGIARRFERAEHRNIPRKVRR